MTTDMMDEPQKTPEGDDRVRKEHMTDERVLFAMPGDDEVHVNDIRALTGMERVTIVRALARLAEQGKVETIGHDRYKRKGE